jgi:hypothetical protein
VAACPCPWVPLLSACGVVAVRYALLLEDEGRFKEAEGEFVAARKPREAVDMYLHQQDWNSAMRVAEQYDPASMSDVLVAQGKLAVEVRRWGSGDAGGACCRWLLDGR